MKQINLAKINSRKRKQTKRLAKKFNLHHCSIFEMSPELLLYQPHADQLAVDISLVTYFLDLSLLGVLLYRQWSLRQHNLS